MKFRHGSTTKTRRLTGGIADARLHFKGAERLQARMLHVLTYVRGVRVCVHVSVTGTQISGRSAFSLCMLFQEYYRLSHNSTS